jgi:hypothetical protein
MTRSSRGDQIVVAPKNDVYTGLAATATLILILALVALVMGANEKFGDGLFLTNGNAPAAQR